MRMLEKGKPSSSPSCHSGGEVAAAELAGAAWRGEQGSSTRWSGSRGSRGRRVWRWTKQEVPCGPPRRRAALNCAGGGEAERERGGRRRVDIFAKSKKFKYPTVKLKLLLN